MAKLTTLFSHFLSPLILSAFLLPLFLIKFHGKVSHVQLWTATGILNIVLYSQRQTR
jgi:hypothetical protein